MAVLPLYTPAINADCLARDEIIEECLNLGMNYVEILSFLVNVHGIHIGLRQIRRILKKLGCRRRGVRSNFNEIVRVMENEHKESGSIIGYRAMHQRLLGLKIDSGLKWDVHTHELVPSFDRKLNLLKSLYYLPKQAKLDFYKVIIISITYGTLL